MASKDSRPKTQAPSEIKLLDFLYGEWGDQRKTFKKYLILSLPQNTMELALGFLVFAPS
jgi:hypothetical protein